MASTSIEYHYTQLKLKHSALVTATTDFGKKKIVNVY
jgi:hypothetical protein